MSTFLPPLLEVRHKAMSLASAETGGVFREEKAAGMPAGPVCPQCGSPALTVRDPFYSNRCPKCGIGFGGNAERGFPPIKPANVTMVLSDGPDGFKRFVAFKPIPTATPSADSDIHMPAVQYDPAPPDDPASTQIDLPPEMAAVLVRLGETIPDDHLAKDGREPTPHITCRYGLTCGVGPVAEAVKDFGPIHYQLGQFKVFPGKKHDVLWASVIAPELHQLHAILNRLPGVESDHKEYTPHVTIAYVQPGMGEVYAAAWNGAIQLDMATAAEEITYSGPDRVPVTIPLCCDNRDGAVAAVEQIREKGCATVAEELSKIGEDDPDGLRIYRHPDGPVYWIDQMDWHDGKLGKRVIRAAERETGTKAEEGYKYTRDGDGSRSNVPVGKPAVFVFNEGPNPAKLPNGDNWEEVEIHAREKGMDDDTPDHERGEIIWSAHDYLSNHPAGQAVTDAALNLLGAEEPDYGDHGNSFRDFIHGVAAHPQGQQIAAHLASDPEARAEVLAHLHSQVREKGMEGEGESSPAPKPTPKPRAPRKPKAAKTPPPPTPAAPPMPANPAPGTMDHLIQSAMANPAVARQTAKHIVGNPQEAEHAENSMLAEHAERGGPPTHELVQQELQAGRQVHLHRHNDNMDLVHSEQITGVDGEHLVGASGQKYHPDHMDAHRDHLEFTGEPVAPPSPASPPPDSPPAKPKGRRKKATAQADTPPAAPSAPATPKRAEFKIPDFADTAKKVNTVLASIGDDGPTDDHLKQVMEHFSKHTHHELKTIQAKNKENMPTGRWNHSELIEALSRHVLGMDPMPPKPSKPRLRSGLVELPKAETQAAPPEPPAPTPAAETAAPPAELPTPEAQPQAEPTPPFDPLHVAVKRAMDAGKQVTLHRYHDDGTHFVSEPIARVDGEWLVAHSGQRYHQKNLFKTDRVRSTDGPAIPPTYLPERPATENRASAVPPPEDADRTVERPTPVTSEAPQVTQPEAASSPPEAQPSPEEDPLAALGQAFDPFAGKGRPTTPVKIPGVEAFDDDGDETQEVPTPLTPEQQAAIIGGPGRSKTGATPPVGQPAAPTQQPAAPQSGGGKPATDSRFATLDDWNAHTPDDRQRLATAESTDHSAYVDDWIKDGRVVAPTGGTGKFDHPRMAAAERLLQQRGYSLGPAVPGQGSALHFPVVQSGQSSVPTAQQATGPQPPNSGAAPRGHHRFYMENGGHFDAPIPPGTDHGEMAKQLGKSIGSKVTHIVDENGNRTFDVAKKTAPVGDPSGARRGKEPHPLNWTPIHHRWAAGLQSSGHGTLGQVYPDGRADVTDTQGRTFVLDKNQVAHVIRTGEYPQQDRATWPTKLSASAKSLEKAGFKVRGLSPTGGGLEVEDKEGGASYNLSPSQIERTVATGQIVHPDRQRRSEMDDLARAFEDKGLGKLVKHLKAAGVYHFTDQEGKPRFVSVSEARKVLNSGRWDKPAKPPVGQDADRIRHVLGSDPQLGELKAVFSIGHKTQGRRYHVVTPDGQNHYPTFDDIRYAKRFGTYPPTEQFESAGLGTVHDNVLDDGTFHVTGPDGESRLITLHEMQQAIADGRLPSIAKPVREPEQSLDVNDWVADRMGRYAAQYGWSADETEKRGQALTHVLSAAADKYGNTPDTWARVARVMKGNRLFLSGNRSAMEVTLKQAFRDHPVNTGGRPTNEKDIRAALANAGLGKLIRMSDSGKAVVVGRDRRGRVMSLNEVHQALDRRKLPPARTLPQVYTPQPAQGSPAADATALQPEAPATGGPAPVARRIPVATAIPDTGGDTQSFDWATLGQPPSRPTTPRPPADDPRTAMERWSDADNAAADRLEGALAQRMPAGLQAGLEAADSAVRRTAGVVGDWFRQHLGGRKNAPTPEPLTPSANQKVKVAARKIAAKHQQHADALAAISRNASWARRQAALHAHKVAHRFGGDVDKAEAHLYKVIRHLAYHAHRQGVGGEAARAAGGTRLRVRRLKSFAPDAGNPMSVLAGMFTS